MKRANMLAVAALIALAAPSLADPLGSKSKGPDWDTADQAEKNAYISGLQITKAGADKTNIMECLDKHADKPLFAQSDLDGVVRMCETIAALSK